MATQTREQQKLFEELNSKINTIAERVKEESSYNYLEEEWREFRKAHPDSETTYEEFLLIDREDVDVAIRPIIEKILLTKL